MVKRKDVQTVPIVAGDAGKPNFPVEDSDSGTITISCVPATSVF